MRAIIAIHAAQVYDIIDETFREAGGIDVLKAMPKSESDRHEIAKLMHPEYVPALWALLRRD